MTPLLNVGRIGTWVVRFRKWSSQRSMQDSTKYVRVVRRVTPVKGLNLERPSGHTVIGVNLARNVPYDYSGALRKLCAALVENSLVCEADSLRTSHPQRFGRSDDGLATAFRSER
jgi:hypothetical protein